MLKLSRLLVAFTYLIAIMAILACSLGSLLAAPATPTMPAAAPTAAAASPEAGSGSMFTLTLPNNQVVSLQVTCAGLNPGEFLDLSAKNSNDVTDPNRTVVQVGGVHAAVGPNDNMFVMVSIGADNAWTFMGNTPQATVTVNADGSGSFTNVAIVNATVTSTTYNAGSEYKFSGQWKCAP